MCVRLIYSWTVILKVIPCCPTSKSRNQICLTTYHLTRWLGSFNQVIVSHWTSWLGSLNRVTFLLRPADFSHFSRWLFSFNQVICHIHQVICLVKTDELSHLTRWFIPFNQMTCLLKPGDFSHLTGRLVLPNHVPYFSLFNRWLWQSCTIVILLAAVQIFANQIRR